MGRALSGADASAPVVYWRRVFPLGVQLWKMQGLGPQSYLLNSTGVGFMVVAAQRGLPTVPARPYVNAGDLICGDQGLAHGSTAGPIAWQCQDHIAEGAKYGCSRTLVPYAIEL